MLQLLLQARRDFLGIWRKSEYEIGYRELKILGRQIVLVNDPDGVKYVMATRHDNYERKSPQMRRALEYLIGDGLFISDGETWKRRRPLVSDIVHKNRLPVYGRVMEKIAAKTAERWAKAEPDETFDMLGEMATLTAEIIARAVFGNDLSPEAARQVTEGFTSYQSLIDTLNISYTLGFDDGLPVRRTKALREAVCRVHGVIDRVIDDHLEGRGDHDAMLDLLMRRQEKNPELGLDRSALRNEAATIFMAGYETTAATLTWAWYLLANAPWAENAMLKELAEVCGDRAPTVGDIPKLDYARAVVEETLRLYPPVAIFARQAKEADTVGPYKVKPASIVMAVPWLLHRTPGLWEKPNHFMPERFLKGRPAPYSYIPFAAGPRICAGLQFGLTEAVLCLATLLQRYRIRIAPGAKVEPMARLSLRPRHGLPVTIERR